MKFFLITFFLIYNIFPSQELSQDEYTIYGQLLYDFVYPSSKLHLGIPKHRKDYLLQSNNLIERKIGKLNNEKKIVVYKLDSIISKYSSEKSLDKTILRDPLIDFKERIIFSNIYFKKDKEAYIFCIVEMKEIKPMSFLLKATKQEDGYWSLEDYIRYY